MTLPKKVKTALNLLHAAGYKAYIVGGAVRDTLMSRTPSDYDVCTSAKPDEIKSVFSSYKTVDKGEKYGTVGVLFDKQPIEITTFRSDDDYADLRHPSSVRFTDELREDLRRRDFTVNAIAYNEQEGLIDPFLGKRDIRKKIIRAVGSAEERFTEDALRIMRAVRFAATLGFSMEESTREAAMKLAPNLERVSAERIRDELSKFIVADNAGDYLLKYREIFFAIIPELKACDGFEQHNPNHCCDVLGHIASTVNHIDPKLILRVAALLHDVGKPECFSFDGERGHFFGHMEKSEEMARKILERLRYPTKFTDTACLIIVNHDKPHSPTAQDARRWLHRVGAENLYLIIRHKNADCLAHDKSYRNRLAKLRGFKREVDAALKRGDCYTLGKLAVNGNEVNRALKISGGEMTGRILEYLLDEVIEGRVKNEKSELLRLAEEYGRG